METYTIDATDKRIGRVATEAANVLRGKNSTAFKPNVVPDVQVTIENASKVAIDESKLENKTYVRYSGYPGGLKRDTLEQVISNKGHAEVVRRAVYGMLPSNRLRAPLMKRLTITD